MIFKRPILLSLVVIAAIAIFWFYMKRIENTSEALFSDVEIYELDQIHRNRPHEHTQLFDHQGWNDFRAYNPSVTFCREQSQLYYSYRVSNYTMCRELPNTLFFPKRDQIKSFIVISSEDGRVFAVQLPSNLSSPGCVQGFEDPRTFIHNGKFYIVANVHSRLNCDTQMFLVSFPLTDLTDNTNFTQVQSIAPSQIIPLETSNPRDRNQMQKNWMPFVHQNRICFVYSVNPHIVYKCDESTGECVKLAETTNPTISTSIRGGSQIQLYKDRYIAFTHKRDANRYSTQIYAFSPTYPFHITHMTDDFMFATGANLSNLLVQFVAGFDIKNDVAYVTYGEQDCHAKVCKIPMQRIMAALKPVDISKLQISNNRIEGF